MTSYPFDKCWTRLIGAWIEIRLDGRAIDAGIVDDAMPGSSALWLAHDGVQHRRIYESHDGYEVWIVPVLLREKSRKSIDVETVGDSSNGFPLAGGWLVR